MTIKRDNLYVWVTWLSRIMSGDDSCLWSRWFKINHQGYEKAPNDFDTVGWLIRHTELVNRLADEYESKGWSIRIEGQNAFKMDWYLTDKTPVIISGKADIIGRNYAENYGTPGNRILVIDAKTGKPKISDRFQVLLYMLFEEFEFLSGFAKPQEASIPLIEGLIVYADYSPQEIPARMLDTKFRDAVTYWLDIIAGVVPRRVPSKSECRFCDITAADCPERIEAN